MSYFLVLRCCPVAAVDHMCLAVRTRPPKITISGAKVTTCTPSALFVDVEQYLAVLVMQSVVQQFKSSLSSQPNSNPDHDKTGQPVVGRDASHERWIMISAYLGCRILLRNKLRILVFVNLVKKIENHLHRHVLQRDLQQNKANNPVQYDDKANCSGRGQCRAV